MKQWGVYVGWLLQIKSVCFQAIEYVCLSVEQVVCGPWH